MTQISESGTAIDSSGESNKPPATPPHTAQGKPVAQGSRAGLLGFSLFLLVAAALGFTGYYGWQYQQVQIQQVNNLKAELENTRKQQQRLQQQFNSSQAELDQSFDKMLNLQQEQRHALNETIEALKTTDRSDWLLAEVEYLLRLANQHAQLSGDIPAALALLESADKVLQELNDTTWLPVRRKIAAEQAALKLHGEMDREGLYLRISAFADQIDQIAVVNLDSLVNQESTEAAEPVVQDVGFTEQLKNNFAKILSDLGGYIKVQHHDVSVGPLLSPTDQTYLKQNIRFMLEQAQLAILQQRQAVYEESLRKTAQWIQQYFQLDPAKKQKLLAEVESFQKHNIAEPLPDISGSLDELKRLTKVAR